MADLATVQNAVASAYEWAREHLDLSACTYGVSHVTGEIETATADYYYFLAGLVATLRCGRICEIGTHYGGSMGAMARGVLSDVRPELVTVDLTQHPTPSFEGYPVRRIRGDALGKDIVERAAKVLSGPADLLFLDALHNEAHTRSCLQVYSVKLTPRIVVLDDIRLNASMVRLWRKLTAEYGGRAIDASEAARRSDCGMGVLVC